MKTMTCNQLGGACDLHLHGETFEEIAEEAKKHGMEMKEQGDVAHLEVMKKMEVVLTRTIRNTSIQKYYEQVSAVALDSLQKNYVI